MGIETITIHPKPILSRKTEPVDIDIVLDDYKGLDDDDYIDDVPAGYRLGRWGVGKADSGQAAVNVEKVAA